MGPIANRRHGHWEYNFSMLVMILTAIAGIIYGIYRATRRWGGAVLWLVAAAVTFFDGAGIMADHLWGPRYSWNFSHHTWSSLPGTCVWFLFYISMAWWSYGNHRPESPSR